MYLIACWIIKKNLTPDLDMNNEEGNDKKIYTLEDSADAFKDYGKILAETKVTKSTKQGTSKEIKIYLMKDHILYTHVTSNLI